MSIETEEQQHVQPTDTAIEPKKEEIKKTFNIRRKRHGLYDWFMMSEQDVLDAFATLKGAKQVGEGDKQFTFVPGERDNRVVLVAHADTVWSEKPDVAYSKGIFKSKKPNMGIGADDRAGIAMLWQLRNMGHSLLIPNAEESHGIGSRFLMSDKEWAKTINDHQFAIQMDRCNDKDLAFYSVGSSAFKDWCEKQFKGYKRVSGSYTDICELCDPMCGVNISIGYYGQHTPNEKLVEVEWEYTLNMLRKVLAKKELPKFIQDPKPVYTPVSYTQYSTSQMDRGEYDHSDDYWRKRSGTTTSLPVSRVNYNGKCDDIIVCTECDGVMDIIEYRQNQEKCIFCKQKF